jgi:sugar phosphate isomerase/epimerase
MIKRTLLLVLFFATAAISHLDARDDSDAEKLGWQLAGKGYTFIKIPLTEAIDICHDLGLKYYEMNPTQKFSAEQKVNTDQNSSPELRAEIKKKFAAAGMKPVAFGVTKLTADEAADRKIFDFAKEMGIGVIVSEPPADAFDMLDKLTHEYGIRVAIHNHPKPNPNWEPEAVLKEIDDHKLIGACADVGHWTRSGLNTIEALKKYEGHIVSLHFKDVNDQKKDVPLGTGISDAKGMLEELRRQNFKGVFSLEYESGGGQQLIDDLKKSVEFFDKAAKEIAEGK